MKRIEGIAFGELDGKGVWTFTADNGYTVVRYDWMVKPAKWWMNLLPRLIARHLSGTTM